MPTYTTKTAQFLDASNIFLTHKQIFRVKNIDNLKQTVCFASFLLSLLSFSRWEF